MPPNKIRLGNALIASASFNKAHGSQPTSATATTLTPAIMRIGDPLDLTIGNSSWRGRAVDVRVNETEGGGLVSQITAVDMRDDLYSATVFGRFNLIDQHTGEVYSILERTPNLDIATLNNTVGEIPQFFLDIPENNWLTQGRTFSKVFPREIIVWLAAVGGFRVAFSSEAENRLRYSAQADWVNSRYNVFNMDWNTGIKVGAGLDYICRVLGLQFHVKNGTSRELKFTVVGEGGYAFAEWSGLREASRSYGSARQSDVDSGVYIVGDRNQIEFWGIPLLPAWNQAWNVYALNHDKLARDLKAKNEDFHMATTLLSELDPEPDENGSVERPETGLQGDDGFVDGKRFNDMTISEYLQTVPFRVYRILGMEFFLSPEEFSGDRPPRTPPIATTLLTSPGESYVIKGHTLNESDPKRILAVSTTTIVELKEGHRLDENTGHVIFDRPKYWLKEEALEKKFSQVTAADYIPDTLTIDCVFYGEVYRKFFGTHDRAGSHHVSGLRKTYLVIDATKGLNPDTDEWTAEGEREADDVAADVANSILERRAVVKSGSEDFEGFAGHEPSGEIRRVQVSVAERQGIRESVHFANDEASPDYDPMIEQSRKLAAAQKVRGLEKLDADTERGFLKASLKQARGEKANFSAGVIEEARLETYNRGNWLRVENSQEETFKNGEPVAATTDADGMSQSVAKEEVKAGDARFRGISIVDSEGEALRVVTTGVIQARVKGPAVEGERLTMAEGGDHLLRGNGPVILLQDVEAKEEPEEEEEPEEGEEEAEPFDPTELVPVRILGVANDGIIECHCATYKNYEFPDPPVATYLDGVDIANDTTGRILRVCVWCQDDPPEEEDEENPYRGNGLYIYNPDAAEGTDPWHKEADFTQEQMGNNIIWIRYGKRWRDVRFKYASEGKVYAIVPKPFRVDHGSAEDETLSGLGQLVTEYEPTEGDIIFVRDQGLFIAGEEEWKQICKIAPNSYGAEDFESADGIGYMVSGEFETVVGVMCEEGDVVGEMRWHEPAIAPPILQEEPEEEE